MAEPAQAVVVLGAGINGAALARELLLNRIPVVLVDHRDYASGTTSWSTRLIHGGLRYLEHGETSLVYESLAERERFLTHSPEHVGPLELTIPVKSQFAGLLSSAAGFLNLPLFQTANPSRGSWAIRAGLTMYDLLAGSQQLGRHRRLPAEAWRPMGLAPEFVDVFSYFDGQIEFPELYVAALVQDAEQISQKEGVPFSLHTYHQPKLAGNVLEWSPMLRNDRPAEPVVPAAVVNASGPAGDRTLAQLGIASPRLLGGTRGSHIISHKPSLLAALQQRGIYAEAFDGRPVFILPWNGAALIGTTDLRHDEDPEVAIATDQEIDYLLRCVNSVLPQVDLTSDDITQHYSGVRPLPFVPEGSTASISRGHWLHQHQNTPWPCYTVIGGKLTTCRSLAEHATEKIAKQIGRVVTANSRERQLPTFAGAERTAPEPGTRAQMLLERLTGCTAPVDSPEMADAAIARLHAKTLEDLIERRLMLIFAQILSRSALTTAAEALSRAGWLAADEIPAAIASYQQRLQSRFGKHVAPEL